MANGEAKNGVWKMVSIALTCVLLIGASVGGITRFWNVSADTTELITLTTSRLQACEKRLETIYAEGTQVARQNKTTLGQNQIQQANTAEAVKDLKDRIEKLDEKIENKLDAQQAALLEAIRRNRTP